MDEKALASTLAKALKSARFEHTQGVVRQAEKLAKRHGLDRARARLAGWLHDCAKQLPPRALRREARLAGADEDELATPSLWHAIAGSRLARTRYHIRDTQVLKAIRWHTTARAGMGPLEKLIYVADYTEPGRHWAGLDKVRKLAFKDLDAGFRRVVQEKMQDLLDRGLPIHRHTLAAWNEAAARD